jgi:hypothetical protein
MSKAPTTWTLADYDRAAEEYLSRLLLDHFTEGIAQAKQREIALASLALLRARRPGVHLLNELLIQYFYKGRLRQVVPDNMILCSEQPLQAVKSFNLELEAAGPFLVRKNRQPSSSRNPLPSKKSNAPISWQRRSLNSKPCSHSKPLPRPKAIPDGS